MKVILEIDHTVSKDEIESWINEILIPQNPCIWGYNFEIHCGNCKQTKSISLTEEEAIEQALLRR